MSKENDDFVVKQPTAFFYLISILSLICLIAAISFYGFFSIFGSLISIPLCYLGIYYRQAFQDMEKSDNPGI